MQMPRPTLKKIQLLTTGPQGMRPATFEFIGIHSLLSAYHLLSTIKMQNRLIIFIFAQVLALLGAQNGLAVDFSDNHAIAIQSVLNKSLVCHERIWPGLKKSSFRIILSSPSSSQAWYFDGESGDLSPLSPVEKEKLVLDPPAYAFSEFKHERVVIVNLDSNQGVQSPRLPVDKAALLAVHEAFHFLFQMKEPWVAQSTHAPRKEDLDHPKALYLRKMLIRSLKENLSAKGNFRSAGYWFEQWLKSGERNETLWSDIMEGTAKYAEIIAAILAQNGCHISEHELVSKAIESLPDFFQEHHNPEVRKILFREYLTSGYQVEGYEIGVLSLLALRQQGRIIGHAEYQMGRDFAAELNAAPPNEKIRVYKEMQEAISRVKSPVELLLKDIKPSSSEKDDELLKEMFKELARQ